MVETRSQKTSEERKELLEVEVNTDHAMNDNQEVHGLEGRVSGTGKQKTSSSFSERMKNTFGNIFPFTMGGGAGNEVETQEEEDEEEQGDFGSQVSLDSSIQENEAYVGRETGTMEKFGVVTTISKEANTPGQQTHRARPRSNINVTLLRKSSKSC